MSKSSAVMLEAIICVLTHRLCKSFYRSITADISGYTFPLPWPLQLFHGGGGGNICAKVTLLGRFAVKCSEIYTSLIYIYLSIYNQRVQFSLKLRRTRAVA